MTGSKRIVLPTHTAVAEFDGSILASDIGGSLKVQLDRD